MRMRSAVLALTLFAYAVPALADEHADRIACSVSVRAGSVDACSRLIENRETSGKDLFMALFNRAWAHRRAGDNHRALADLDAAERIDRSYANLYLTRAMVRESLTQVDGAVSDLDRYIALEPQDWTGFYRRALVHRLRNQPKSAYADLTRAAALNPYEKALPALRIIVLSDLGKHDAARGEADKLLGARRSDPLGRYARAVVLFRLGKRAEATADLDAAIQTSPLFAAAHALKAEIAEVSGDLDAARTSYEHALRVGGLELDAEAARDKARRRLAGTGVVTAATSDITTSAVASAKPVEKTLPSKVSEKSECRRFIPAVSTTITVACD